MFMLSLGFGIESQVQLLFVPVAALPVVLFRLKNIRSITILSLFTISLFISLYLIDFGDYFLIPIEPDYLFSLRFVFNITALLCQIVVIYAIISNYDSTEKKLDKTNELLQYQFQTMFDNSFDALFLIDWKKRKIVKANKRAVHLFEFEKESDFFESDGADFYFDELSIEELDAIKEILITKGSYESEVKYRTNLGNVFWGSLAIRLISIGGNPYQSVRVTDITAQKNAEKYTKAALQEKEILLAEIHHRVKNNMAVISGLIGLQSSYVEDVKAKELFEESRNRIHSMALIHDKLYQHETFAKIEFCAYINDLVDYIKSSYNDTATKINFSVTCNDIYLDIKNAVPCGLILNELVSNAFKHAFKGKEQGEIKIVCTKMGEKFTMMVADDGVGYDAETALKKSNSLGLTLINALVEQVSGTLKTTHQKGTAYYISFEA
ncbi:MAG: ATP-binding protein [Bacteroidia bacterium]|nr:ATP-binding protein [Bacteroidia bacterium]